MESHINELHAILKHHSLDKLFTPDFMLAHTKFETIEAMLTGSGFENIEDLLSDKGRAFITENTGFKEGSHFFAGAKGDWMSRQIL